MQNQLIDWVNLPSNAVAQSLSGPLHDSELLSVRSDSLERTVTLEVEVAHVLVPFIMILHGVESARATAFANWPGDVPEVQGMSYEEQNRLTQEFQAKGCEESVGWKDFQAAFPSNTLDIYDAYIARDENHLTLQIHGSLDGNDFDDQWFSLFIRSQRIEFRQSDGPLLDLEQFVKLSEDYWEAWRTQR
ncbi:MAG: hypothetical protein V4671_25725 [Armatimonadota bacterium]